MEKLIERNIGEFSSQKEIVSKTQQKREHFAGGQLLCGTRERRRNKVRDGMTGYRWSLMGTSTAINLNSTSV